MSPRTFRWILFLAGSLCILIGSLPFASLEAFDSPSLGRTCGFLLQAIGVALCWGFYPLAENAGRRSILLIYAVAVGCRLVLIPTPLSDDAHRYRWEGKLVLAGKNPFAQTAEDPSLLSYRDENWAAMNHRDRGTVYPPFAQFLFAGIAAVPSSDLFPVEKMVFIAADLGTLALVLLLLRRRNLPDHFSLFYALNPVVLISFAGEGHFDSIFVFLLTASILALESQKSRTSWILLAASIQVKFVSLILLPIWILSKQYRGALLAILVILVLWIPFLSGIPAWIRSLNEFGGGGTFQGLIPLLLRTFSLPESLSTPIGALGGGIALLFVFYKGGTPATVARRVIGFLLIFSPILHFWYLSWIIPFVALRPSLSWIWLCASQSLYFLVWNQKAETGYWELPPGAEWVVWGPFLVLGILELNRFRHQGRFRPSESKPSYETIGVVIPTYQAADTLEASLDSIEIGTHTPDQCLIVDARSTDTTSVIAATRNVPVLQTALGRGGQIQTGIEALDTDWVLILHADCLLHPQALEMIGKLGPEVVGGACGQRFSPGNPILTLVEFMNEGRAALGESYWGDQAMFFRRNHKNVWEGMKAFPLMEDVEMSRLLRREGETRYLGLPAWAGTAKWKSGKRFHRFLLVFGTVIRFRAASFLGRQANIAGALYDRYYGKGK